MPVLYAGDSLGCALGETVFHDLPDDPTLPAEIFRADLLTLRAGFFTVTRAITVVDLIDPALTTLNLNRDDVIDTPPVEYPTAATWGQAAWDATKAQGIVWNSRRSHGQLSYVLFVDPSRPADRSRAVHRNRDLQVTQPPLPLHDGNGLGHVLTAASADDVTVIF